MSHVQWTDTSIHKEELKIDHISTPRNLSGFPPQKVDYSLKPNQEELPRFDYNLSSGITLVVKDATFSCASRWGYQYQVFIQTVLPVASSKLLRKVPCLSQLFRSCRIWNAWCFFVLGVHSYIPFVSQQMNDATWHKTTIMTTQSTLNFQLATQTHPKTVSGIVHVHHCTLGTESNWARSGDVWTQWLDISVVDQGGSEWRNSNSSSKVVEEGLFCSGNVMYAWRYAANALHARC